ncbi:MAG TPA: glycosyltransferase family 39 protein [Candidatus Baltobacteraceae bacterium]|nr:glycosyltransferase family 39 protein [Candidatus Baltobacteraceae bacterium]
MKTPLRGLWLSGLAGAFFASLVTLPGLGIGTLWDNSETAYAEVAREILRTGDPIVMHFNGTPWFIQPPLYFWIAALFAKFLGMTSFAFRLPSALATIGIGTLVGVATARMIGTRAAVLATLILSASLLHSIIGRLAIMDALLDFGIVWAIFAWVRAIREGDATSSFLAWIALALGVLAKGPIALVIVALVIIPWAWWERQSGVQQYTPTRAGLLSGVLIFALITVPWYVMLSARAGYSALGTLLGHYSVGRYLGIIENQSGPIWYYLPVLVLGFFPWFAFVIPALVSAWNRRNDVSASLERLLIVWSIVPLVFFSLAQTKLPNYIALEMPALAIAVAMWFIRVAELDNRRTALAWSALVPLSILAIALAGVRFSQAMQFGDAFKSLTDLMIKLGIIIAIGAVLCMLLLIKRVSVLFAPWALAGATFGALFVIAFVGLPLVEQFKPIPQLAAVIERERRPGDIVAIQSLGGSNGLIFYTRPHVVTLDAPDDLKPNAQNDPRLVICAAPRAFVVTSQHRPAFDPTYGRNRRVLAKAANAILYLYDGPACL